MTRSLEWLPENWEKQLSMAMTSYNDSLDDLKKRQTVIGEIHTEIEGYLNDYYEPMAFAKMKRIKNYPKRQISGR